MNDIENTHQLYWIVDGAKPLEGIQGECLWPCSNGRLS